jgi:hypothetical protein
MESIAISTEVTLRTKECPVCGVVYAMPEMMDAQKRQDKGTFYCPNGHSLWYGENEADRLRAKLDQREAELESTHVRLNEALQNITTKKREITRIKNRVHNGVCTECHRHFDNLERHMKTKHDAVRNK